MKYKQKILLAVIISIVIFGGLNSQSLISKSQYLQGIVASIKNKDFITASGQYGGGTPFVTVAVEKYTTNKLPNITGTCSIGSNMNFTIKKGATGVVSETFSKLCDASPYTTNPTIMLPDGKYRVDVKIGAGCAINNTIQGTVGDDTIAGTPGNDLINGNGGNDTLSGGPGCDTIYNGSAGNQNGGFTFMNGDGGDDTIYGGAICVLPMPFFKNPILPRDLALFIFNTGSIVVNAQNTCGQGVNLLNGSNDTLFGVGEKDILVGDIIIPNVSGGADYFYLGNDQGSYYVGSGDSDYAEIRNFDCATDFLQLTGSPGDYNIIYAGNTASIYKVGSNGNQDLIAKVNSAPNGLNSGSSCFNYPNLG
jgi:Ca2+-binding RTX toxin-like protein